MPIENPEFSTLLEEGVIVATRPKINFIGASVTAADNPGDGRIDVTIAGGGGAGDMTVAVYDPAGIAEQLVGLVAVQELDNKTLDSSVLKGTFTASGIVTLPAITLAGDLTMALLKIHTTNLTMYDGGVGAGWTIRNAADSAYARLTAGDVLAQGDYLLNASTSYIRTQNADGFAGLFGARDTGVGIVEVARLQGAADPYFQMTLPVVLLPIATASLPATPVEGMLTYDATLDELTFRDSDSWEVILTRSDLDNTAGGTDALITSAPTSNVLYDHGVATTGVHGVGAGTIAKTADITATKLDDFATPDDNTDLNANTTNHGLLLKATAPAVGLYNYVGITNGETVYTNKALFDATAPTDSDAVSAGAVGTAATAARRDHIHKVDAAIADDAVLTVDSADAADNEYARFTASGLESRTVAEVIADLLSVALPEDTAIILDASISADGHYSGIVEAGTAGATLAFGDLVYYAVADSRWELAKADVAATSFGKLGICVLAAANDGSATTILLYGKVNGATAFPALTIGAPVFISAATAGDITITAPTGTTNFVVRIVGYGNTADELFFCPDLTYIELA